MFDAKDTAEKLTDWVKEYFQNNATPETKAVVGISGGKDSSTTAAVCVAALGKERVVGVLMPQGSQADIDVAYDLVRTLGIEYVEVNIGETVAKLYGEIEKSGLTLNTAATFNTPARIRMTTLYAVSAIVGGRVVNTCNWSEDWVGYSTKYGDSAGDLSPLMHLTVGEVKAVGRELGLPDRFIDKVPLDGLCGKTDEENLGFTYATLDTYIRTGVCEDEKVRAEIDRLHKMNLHKISPMPAFEL
ncbi:MAG: NAD(+) synthase [Lachnospiraceae bacterium]|jgi:NAD+ synthase|nr:NAD(+) synthase [Lachnospiraceae bacterium]